MEHRFTVRTVDYHTAGEPFRIVTDVPPLHARTVADKRVEAMRDPAVDGLRALLCSEPRGHADMYGGFITEPDDDGAHFGVLFWHKDGFSTACGHGTIALGAWAIRTGRVPIADGGVTDVVIDVPSGRVTARVATGPDGKVRSVDFVNVPSYQLHDLVKVETSAGTINTAISFGGAIYAHVDAADLGLTVTARDLPRLIELSREMKYELNGTRYAEHPADARLNGVYGVIFFEDLGDDETGNPVQRNVTVFADGEVDRSPCGSGTCARIATLAATGRLTEDRHLVHHSIVGSTFRGRVIGRGVEHGRDAVTPMVTGTAYATGEHVFVVDPDDDMTPGFVLR
ncbi:proline racemase family protein [Streptomyces ferrugineus]|uniref:Proline racemase family protein n=1 Tax=Streptomyces ferrugineus TaxID=1413221 RepID=A0A7M2SVR8_9ACTN|nr:proline racemase family protein [Streptomyces ferrugineus]QOV40344.1 proline racemase family protein [Streptomyces ferrugineus]